MSTVLKSGLQQQPAPRPAAPAVLPPIRYAAAAAAAVSGPSASSSSLATAQTPTTPAAATPSHPPPPPPTAPSIPPALAQEQQSAATSSPSLTQLSVTSPMLSSAASVSQQPDGSFYSGQESPALSEAVGAKAVPQSPQRDTTQRKGLLTPIPVESTTDLALRICIFAARPQPVAKCDSKSSICRLLSSADANCSAAGVGYRSTSTAPASASASERVTVTTGPCYVRTFSITATAAICTRSQVP